MISYPCPSQYTCFSIHFSKFEPFSQSLKRTLKLALLYKLLFLYFHVVVVCGQKTDPQFLRCRLILSTFLLCTGCSISLRLWNGTLDCLYYVLKWTRYQPLQSGFNSTTHRECFACSCLPVCINSAIISLENSINDWFCFLKDLALGAILGKDPFEVVGPCFVVFRTPDLNLLGLIMLNSDNIWKIASQLSAREWSASHCHSDLFPLSWTLVLHINK